MNRVQRVVEQSGMKMDDIVSMQVFCTDLPDYDAFNRVKDVLSRLLSEVSRTFGARESWWRAFRSFSAR